MGASPARLGVLVVSLVAAVLIGAPGVASATPTQLNPPGTNVEAFKISSDGARVVYWSGNKYFTVPIGGGTPVALPGSFPSSFDAGFQISNDSTRVVYLSLNASGQGALLSAPIGGGPHAVLFDSPSETVASYQLSADSQRVVMRLGMGDVLSVPITGGPAVTLMDATPGGVQTESFKISPDASRVIVRTLDTGKNPLVSVPIAGGPATTVVAESLVWDITPDALKLVFTDTVDGAPSGSQHQLFSVPITGGTPTRLSPTSGGELPIRDVLISPDSAWVAFGFGPSATAGAAFDAWGVPTAGGTAKRVGPQGGAGTDSFQITANSASVVTREGSNLHLGTFAGGYVGMLAADISSTTFVLPPDSARVLYSAVRSGFNDDLYMKPFAAVPETSISSPHQGIGNFAVSPGGGRAYFTTFALQELFRVPTTGGTPEKVDSFTSDLQWSATGAHMAYLKQSATKDLFAFAHPGGPDAPGGPPPIPPGPGGQPPPPPGPAGTRVGLVNPSQGQWHLRATGGQVTSFFFGNPGDIPVMGDWDCDGVDTPGLFRQSDAFAYLSNANRSQIADIRFFFGDPADLPLAGDFDGDGCDSLSIYRPGEGRFYIINDLGENEGGLGAADFSFGFGDLGDKPVVGDWDGDGVDEIGLHRESTGLFYWRNTLTTGIADGSIIFGDPGDRFVAGDWGTVDGRDTPGLFRPSAERFFFRHTLTQGNADSEVDFGETPWRPVSGEFGL